MTELLRSETPTDTLSRIRDLRRCGQMLQALDLIDEALPVCTTATDLSALHAEAAVNLRLLGRYQHAAAALKLALKLNPDNIKARNLLARRLLHENNLQQAQMHIGQVLIQDPENQDALDTMARIKERMSRLDISVVRAPTPAPVPKPEKDRDTISYLCHRAISLRYAKRIDDAVDLLRKAMVEHADAPDLFKLKISLGQIHVAAGQIEQAHDVFLDVLNTNPDDKYALTGLASIYLKSGLLDEAERRIDQLRNHDPGNPFMQASRIELLVAQDRLSEAREEYSRFTAAQGQNAMMQGKIRFLARLLTDGSLPPASESTIAAPAALSSVAESAIDTEQAVPVDPVPASVVSSPEDLLQSFRTAGLKPKAPTRRQVFHARLHQFDEVTRPAPVAAAVTPIDLLRERISRNPRDVGAHFSLAGMLQRGGDEEGAVHHFRTVLAIDSKNSPAMQALRKLGRDIAG